MKRATILLTLFFIAGCVSEKQTWYDRLKAVEGGHINDSTIRVLSADTNFVRYIEQLDSMNRASAQANVERMRRQDSMRTYYLSHN